MVILENTEPRNSPGIVRYWVLLAGTELSVTYAGRWRVAQGETRLAWDHPRMQQLWRPIYGDRPK